MQRLFTKRMDLSNSISFFLNFTGFSKDRNNVVEVKSQQLQQQQQPILPQHQPPPPAQPAYDMTMYSTYAAHWGPGFDPRALKESCGAVPVTIPGLG